VLDVRFGLNQELACAAGMFECGMSSALDGIVSVHDLGREGDQLAAHRTVRFSIQLSMEPRVHPAMPFEIFTGAGNSSRILHSVVAETPSSFASSFRRMMQLGLADGEEGSDTGYTPAARLK
jgi:hypothetical protein